MRRSVALLAVLFFLASLASAQTKQTGNFTFSERGPVVGNLYRLGLQNDPAGIPVFTQALKDPDPAVREAAVAQLLFTHDERALDPVVAVVKDDSRVVRRLAIATLERIGSKQAVPALTEALSYRPPDYDFTLDRSGKRVRTFEILRPEERFNQLAAALALHKLGSDAGRATVLEILRNPASKNVQSMALQAVIEMDLKEAVPDCIRIAREWNYFGEDSSGLFALRALEKVADDTHRAEIVQLALDKNDALGMHAAMWTLALLVKFGDKDMADVFTRTLDKTREHEHILHCLRGIEKFKPEGAASLIVKNVLPPRQMNFVTNETVWLREFKIFQMGCETLAALQDKSVVPGIKQWYDYYSKPDDWFIYRLWLAWTLAELDDKSGLDALHTALSHDDPAVRRLAAKLLGKLGDKSSLPPLVAAIKKESEPYTFQVMKTSIASLGPVPQDREVLDLPAPPEPPVPADTYNKPRLIFFSFDDCATPEAMERITGLMEELASHDVRWAFTLYYAPISRFDWEYNRVLVQRCFDRGCEVENHTLYHNPDGRSVTSSNDEQLRGNIVACNNWLRTYIRGLDKVYRWKGGGGGFSRPGDSFRSWRDVAEILPEARFSTDIPEWWRQPTIPGFDTQAPPFHTDSPKVETPGRARLLTIQSLGDLRYDFDADTPDERIRAFVASFDYWYFNQPQTVMTVIGHDWPNAPVPDRYGNEMHWDILSGAIRQVLLDRKDRYPHARAMTDLELVHVFKKGADPLDLIARKVSLQTDVK